MIKATELRIGNLIEIDGVLRAVTAGIILTIDNIQKPNATPIPLTEEWLVRFGFRCDGCNGYVIDIKNAFLWIELSGGYAVGVPYEASGGSFKIKYVHQLQNLYFALTGEELQLQTPVL